MTGAILQGHHAVCDMTFLACCNVLSARV